MEYKLCKLQENEDCINKNEIMDYDDVDRTIKCDCWIKNMAYKLYTNFMKIKIRMELFINNDNIDKVGMMMVLQIGSLY